MTVPAELADDQAGERAGEEAGEQATAERRSTLAVVARIAEPVAVAALVIAVVVAAIRILGQRWLPASDEALMELLIRDVPTNMPLTGVYSRLGYNHPGPAQFILLAAPYRLFGSSSAALSAAMLTVHLAGMLLAWGMARRVDRLAALLTLVVLQLAALSLYATELRMIWNPYLAVVAAATLVVAAWSAAERDPLGSVLVVPIGSLLVQSHGAAVYLVTAVCAAGALAAVWSHRSTRQEPAPSLPIRAWGAGLGIAALMWLPPVIDQVNGSGNLGKILSSGGSDGPAVGISGAAAAISEGFALVPSWVKLFSGATGFGGGTFRLPVLALVPLIGLVLALKRKDRTMVRGLSLALIAVGASFVGTALIPAPLYLYLYAGQRGIAAVTVAIGLASIVRSAASAAATSTLVIAAASLSVALSIVVVTSQWNADVPTPEYQAPVEVLSQGILADMEANDVGSRVDVSAQVGWPTMASYTGVRLQIERAGTDATDGDSWSFPDGPRPAPAGTVQYSIVAPDTAAALEADGWTTVAEYQPFSEGEQRELSELDAALLESVAAEGDASGARQLAAQVRESNRIREQVADVTDGRIAVAAVRRADLPS